MVNIAIPHVWRGKLSPLAEASQAQWGGKARSLAKLHTLPDTLAHVPHGVVISATVFDSLPNELQQRIRQGDVQVTLPEHLAQPLLSYLAAVAPLCFWAVRSSALDEDGQQASFAGQFDSFLNIPLSEVPQHICRVWASGFAERSLAYRQKHGLSHNTSVPAVLLQEMVVAHSAGICFSADPVQSERGVCVISAVAGLADRLVSGEVDGELYRVSAENHVFATANGTLDPEQVLRIAQLARYCEQQQQHPQDIEWAFDAQGVLYLLQSRPITTLEKVIWWDNSNIIESYSGISSPLTYTFAARAYRTVYRRLLTLFGVPSTVIAQNGEVLDNMIGYLQGQIYYNLSNWYRALSLLPGFSFNRRFMEQMMGVASGMPAELQVQSQNSKGQDTWYFAKTLMGLWRSFKQLPALRRRFYQRLNRVLNQPKALDHLSISQLMQYYRKMDQELLEHWDAPLVNDFCAMVFYGVLRQLCGRWLDGNEALQNDLIGASGSIISAEPAQKLQEMADYLRSNPPALADFSAVSRSDLPTVLARWPQFKQAFDAYLQRFSNRCLEELKLESPTWSDEPEILAQIIARLARYPQVEQHAQSRREAAENVVHERLNGWQKAIFFWVLGYARECIIERENLRFERTRVFGEARRVMRALGRQFQQQGILERADLVFYLTLEELLAYADGRSVSRDIGAVAQLRYQENQQFTSLAPLPRRFRSLGYPYRDLGQFNVKVPTSVTEHQQGTPCSPGMVRGTVRVIRDPKAIQLQEPCIFVAERTDPGWIIILPLALGLIVERGSLLSHSAIVSRELGIPGIVGVNDVTAWLQDGDEIEMDGSSGRIKLLKRANP